MNFSDEFDKNNFASNIYISEVAAKFGDDNIGYTYLPLNRNFSDEIDEQNSSLT